MSQEKQYAPGTFCWWDLGARDADVTKNFYAQLFNWTPVDSPNGYGGLYTMFFVGDRDVAGLAPMSPEMQEQGIPTYWMSLVAVEDADATVEKALQANASVLMPVTQVMDHGRMAVLRDPTGAAFGIWQPGGHKGASISNSSTPSSGPSSVRTIPRLPASSTQRCSAGRSTRTR